MNKSEVYQTFISHFGEMGSRWGINRTTGQIYAVFYLSEKPVNADDLVEILEISRSGIAAGIKELLAMNLIKLKHLPCDRKDYYETYRDIWDIVRNLVEERKKREVEPTLDMLGCLIKEDKFTKEEQFAKQRINEMHTMIALLTEWYDEIKQLENKKINKLLKIDSKLKKIVQKGGSLFAGAKHKSLNKGVQDD